MPRTKKGIYLNNPPGKVKNGSHLLMAAVIAQAAQDALIMSHNRGFYNRKYRCKPADELLLSVASLERWLDDPGVLEFWLSWQHDISPESVRSQIRRILYS